MSNPKGCYNCMKRRIICDRTVPQCTKCIKKGIPCPGIGVRYRFNDGVASRGKLKGKSIPVVLPESSKSSKDGVENAVAQPQQPRPENKNEKTTPSSHSAKSQSKSKVVVSTGIGEQILSFDSDVVDTSAASSHLAEIEEVDNQQQLIHLSGNTSDVFEFPDYGMFDSTLAVSSIPRTLELLNPSTRMLFSHFSKAVSPVMLLLDGEFNGYRKYILPLACEDEVLGRAVSIAAAFHLSPKMPELRRPSAIGRDAIISKLCKDVLHGSSNKILNEKTWATILLLLIAELVIGGEDFAILYRILVSFVDANTNLGSSSPLNNSSPMVLFLQEQTNLIKFFAHPVMDEELAIETLASEVGLRLSFMSPNLDRCEAPHRRSMVSVYKEAYQRAGRLYLHRATNGRPLRDAIDDVDEIRQLLQHLPPSTPGAHALIWVYFVAGAESILEEHRQFFYGKLDYWCQVTGYANVKVAMDMLKKIWADEGDQAKWTRRLPKISGTLIM